MQFYGHFIQQQRQFTQFQHSLAPSSHCILPLIQFCEWKYLLWHAVNQMKEMIQAKQNKPTLSGRLLCFTCGLLHSFFYFFFFFFFSAQSPAFFHWSRRGEVNIRNSYTRLKKPVRVGENASSLQCFLIDLN